MAEGILKQMLKDKNNDIISINSAGTNAISGMPATIYSQESAKKGGINLSFHKSKPVTESLIEKNDIILVMTQEHIDFFKCHFLKYLDKVYVLKKFNNPYSKTIDIADPMGSDLESYEKIFKEIKKEIERIYPILIKIAKNNE